MFTFPRNFPFSYLLLGLLGSSMISGISAAGAASRREDDILDDDGRTERESIGRGIHQPLKLNFD